MFFSSFQKHCLIKIVVFSIKKCPLLLTIFESFQQINYLHVLERGSRGPSTVTLMALVYVATCGGLVDIVIVTEKLLPIKMKTGILMVVHVK